MTESSSNLAKGLFERFLVVASPVYLIPKKAWISQWEQRETLAYTKTLRFFSSLLSVIYLAHIFLVDLPAHKEFIERWIYYRVGCSVISALVFAFTFTSLYNRMAYKRVPLFLVSAVCVYMQGQSMEWRTQVPSFYVPILAGLCIIAMRQSVFLSSVSLLALLGISEKWFFLRPDQTQHMVSASLVVLVVIGLIRSRQKQDVVLFIAEQENLASQKQIAEIQIQLVNQIRTFLPKLFYTRVLEQIKVGKTPLQAVDEILKPKKVFGAVLFTDIRGFTGLTKQGDETLLSSVIPAQKNCTDVVEFYKGIPRLVGDLVHAYFDNMIAPLNIRDAALAAIDMSLRTRHLNLSLRLEQRITRYIIITFGSLIVGNIGGSEGSRDVSALGNAANLPSRIDRITKKKNLAALLTNNPIIFSEEAKSLLMCMYKNLELQKFDLLEPEYRLDDFPDERHLYLMAATEHNFQILKQPFDLQAAQNYIVSRYVNRENLANEGKKAA